MARTCYVERTFRASSMAIIDQANAICAEYAAQGFMLTLRQLYYQYVARGIIPNKDTEYDRLGSIINDARLAGLIDWNYLEDRTRNLQGNQHWDSPKEIVDAVASAYRNELWNTQPYRVEVWVEKEALAGVIERTARDLDVNYFSCRGYVSQSEMHAAAMRMRRYERSGQDCIVIHLGDHDPSGIDMTRDIQDRLDLFGCSTEVRRIALNMNQVQQYNPPPNPAKLSDSRCGSYIERFGDESWELDALDPATLDALIRDAVEPLRDDDLWEEALSKQERDRHHLTVCSENWSKLVAHLDDVYGEYEAPEDDEEEGE